MNSSGEAAESVVRIVLQGTEMYLRVAGSATKELLALLAALSKGHTKTKGKTSLSKILKSGKEIKVFSIKQDDLKKFAEEAKRYGVLYHAIVNKKDKNPDSLVDIMVKAEDASKINRIVQKFNLYTTNNATIKHEIEKEQEQAKVKEESKNKDKKVEDLVDDIMSPTKEQEQVDIDPMKSPQSDPSYKNKNYTEEEVSKKQKPSVKEQLNKIKEEQKEKNKEKGIDKNEGKIKKDNKKNNRFKRKKAKERG
ncbi:MAG: PcfB family protein [bacterium]|nr:PcfB family protein [bacterium]